MNSCLQGFVRGFTDERRLISRVDVPKFLAVHDMAEPVSVEVASAMGKKVRDLTTQEVRLINTWVQLTEEGLIERIYCCWESPDAESIRRILNEAQFPLGGVYPMAEVDPSTL